jgi:hypothetical protein
MDWVYDWGLVLVFFAVFVIFVKVNWKDTYAAAEKTDNAPAARTSSASPPGAGTNAEITAVISAAINEYKKNNN